MQAELLRDCLRNVEVVCSLLKANCSPYPKDRPFAREVPHAACAIWTVKALRRHIAGGALYSCRTD